MQKIKYNGDLVDDIKLANKKFSVSRELISSLMPQIIGAGIYLGMSKVVPPEYMANNMADFIRFNIIAGVIWHPLFIRHKGKKFKLSKAAAASRIEDLGRTLAPMGEGRLSFDNLTDAVCESDTTFEKDDTPGNRSYAITTTDKIYFKRGVSTTSVLKQVETHSGYGTWRAYERDLYILDHEDQELFDSLADTRLCLKLQRKN